VAAAPEGGEVKIAELAAGEMFRLAALPHKTGEVVRIGEGAAVVRYGGPVRKRFKVRSGDEVIAEPEFDAPSRAVTIALETEVERITLGGNGCSACSSGR
jgi:hypothetical protein